MSLPVTLAADVSATTASADLSLLSVHLNDGLAGHALTAGGAGSVSLGSVLGLPFRWVALVGAGLCLFLRLMSIYRGWRLPTARPQRGLNKETD